MIKRWVSSRWLWLAIYVVVGSLVCTIPALTMVRQTLELSDSLSSEFKQGLSNAGGSVKETRRMSVGFLFGLVEIKDTSYPYVWTAIGGIIIGSGLGLIVWLLGSSLFAGLASGSWCFKTRVPKCRCRWRAVIRYWNSKLIALFHRATHEIR